MRIAIVGCGLIGQKRAAAAKAHEIRIVADTDRGRAEHLAAKTGARAVTDWHAALDEDVDVVFAATPHQFLSEVALAAVRAGKHVLVEKPAGRVATEFAPVVDEARRGRRTVRVGYNHRFHPAIMQAQQIAASGEIGQLMFIRGRYGHGGRIGYEKEWRAMPELSGGGELIDQGAHLIDLARWLMGPLALAHATLETYFWNMPVEDNCFLALKGQRGETAWLHASWTEWKNMFSLEIYGRTGKVVVDGLGGSYGTERLTYHKMLPEMGPPKTTTQEFDGPDLSWTREVDAFEAAIAGRSSPSATMDDGLAVLETIQHAYESRRS